MQSLAALFTALTILGWNGTDGQKKVMKCSLTNRRCNLPFQYGGKVHQGCITDGVTSGRAWCPVKVFEDGTANLHYCMECWGDQRCYYTGDSFPDTSWIISCPPGCYYVQKLSYGTDNKFSAASYVCATAIHEGLIQNTTGGDVILSKMPWKEPFVGEKKNDIKTYSANKENIPMMKFQKNFEIAPTPHVIFTEEGTTISSLRSGSFTANSIVTNQKFASGLTCDVRKRKIFWSDLATGTIFSATFNGNKVTNQKKILQDQVQKPEMLAFDWVHGNLYWSDKATHSVSVSDMNGRYVATLIKRDDFEPEGLAVDPRNGNFYVADSGRNPKIERCSMAERDSCHTIVNQNIVSPAGLAVDISHNALCWADREIPQISCTSLEGTHRKNMKFSKQRLKGPLAIALVSGRVYWTDLFETIVGSADLSTWDSFHVHLGDVTKATGLAIFDAKAQPNYPNKCPIAPCEQICVPTKDSYLCMCKDGEYPHGDGSCGSEPLILQIVVAETTSITQYTVNPDTSSLSSAKTILTGLKKAAAVAIDTRKKTMYWSDVKAKTIDMAPLSADLNFAGRHNFLDADDGYLSSAEGIAIDSITRLFYWTDTDLHAVYVTNLDPASGQNHITALIKGDKSYRPRGIALDPKHGYIYVVDSATPYKIQQCKGSGGKSCRNLIEIGLNQPNWITIDYAAQRLYFTNFFGTKISSTDFEGEDRQELNSGIQQPYGIGVHNNKVYWSDQASSSIFSVDKSTGSGRTKIARSANQLMGLLLFDPKNPDPDLYPNVCAQSDCRYLCVPTPRTVGNGPHCLCPDIQKGKSDAKECACKDGYKPSPIDSQICIDIDECIEKLNYGGCITSGNCINTDGSYACNCGAGYVTTQDKKSCLKLSPCASNPCQNRASCQEKNDNSDYSCSCLEGFMGKNCENLDVELKQWKDDTGAIHLRCKVPKTVRSEIIWMLNRVQIDSADRWPSLTDGGKELVIQLPHYTHSGIFYCQFTYGGIERISKTIVEISTLPKYACGDSPGIDALDRLNSPKIFGGTTTKMGSAPFVAMLYKTTEHYVIKKGAICGGSLVDNKHVVTAAHCFHRVSIKEIIVYVGKLNTDPNEERYQQSSRIEKLMQHPEHNPSTLHNDIAILVLKEKVYFSAGVKPICVPAPDDKSEEVKSRPWSDGKTKYGIVYGWGLTKNLTSSQRLLEVILPIRKQSKCKKAFAPGDISNSMFCAGGEKNKDACEGDSGGPFTLWSKRRSKWYLGGIVSWGEQCGRSEKPGVYTRIGTSLRMWIYDNTDLSRN